MSANTDVEPVRRDLLLSGPLLKERLSPAVSRRNDEAVERPVPYTGPVGLIPGDDLSGLRAGTIQYVEYFRKSLP